MEGLGRALPKITENLAPLSAESNNNARLVLRQIDDLDAGVAKGAVSLAPVVTGGNGDIVVVVVLIIVDDLGMRTLLFLGFGFDSVLARLHPAD